MPLAIICNNKNYKGQVHKVHIALIVILDQIDMQIFQNLLINNN